MKTVRLPIFENGVETNEVVEVNISQFLLPPSQQMNSHFAAVVPKEVKESFTGQKVENG